jgi:CheY-like chemotaxis protein
MTLIDRRPPGNRSKVQWAPGGSLGRLKWREIRNPDMSRTASETQRVAIFNSRADFIEALRMALEVSGFATAWAHLADIQDGSLDLIAFVERHKPALIIYDLPRPYERHWNFLRLLKETSSLKTATWVLTTRRRSKPRWGPRASSRSSSVSRMACPTSSPLSVKPSRSGPRAREAVVVQTLASVKVLVVDDDADVRGFLTDSLEIHGATVTAVETAPAALATLQAWRPDVLVSDLQMPDKDGYWLIAEVRALTPERGGMTPAACLTGLVEPEDRAEMLRAGFQYHIAKPVPLGTLIGIVTILALKP